MTRKGENIFKRKDGRWEIRIPVGRKDGKTKYKFLYADSYNEAKRKKLTALEPLTKKEKEEREVSFSLVAEEFLKKARLSLKESSYSRYHRLILSHITPFFKETLFCDLNNFTVSAFSLALSEKHSPKTVFCILILLKEIIRFGEKNGFRCDVKEIVYPTVKKNNIMILSPNHLKLLNESLKESQGLTALGIKLTLHSGIRIGELCGLKWEDIDLDNGTISINRTVERIETTDPNQKEKTKLIMAEPKTENAKRVIPISSSLMGYLEKYKGRNEAFLLTGSERASEPRVFYARYKNFMKKIGLTQYNFHALRHTFATNCIEAGVDPKSLSEILGHSSVTVTMKFYVHPTLEQKRKQLEKLTY